MSKIYRHKKRGTLYTVIGMGHLQCEKPLTDMSVIVIYRGEDGNLWARDPNEFYDGRFEEILE